MKHPSKKTIDSTKAPSLPFPGTKMVSHDTSMGEITWNPKDYELHLEPEQKDGYLRGTELQKRLKGTPVLNATVFDWLLEHPDQIPESWKEDSEGLTNYIYFWGTMYKNADGRQYVRYCYFDDGVWQRSYGWLDFEFDGRYPAARASTLPSVPKTLPSVPMPLDGSVIEIGGVKYKLKKV